MFSLEWNATGEDCGTPGSIVSVPLRIYYYLVGAADEIVETTKS